MSRFVRSQATTQDYQSLLFKRIVMKLEYHIGADIGIVSRIFQRKQLLQTLCKAVLSAMDFRLCISVYKVASFLYLQPVLSYYQSCITS